MKPLFENSALSSIERQSIQPYSLISTENKGIREGVSGLFLLLRGLFENKGFIDFRFMILVFRFKMEVSKHIKTLFSKVRRTYTWITLCKHSATQGYAIQSLIPNSVGVQPATGLLCLPSFTPRYATLTRGYQCYTPSELKNNQNSKFKINS